MLSLFKCECCCFFVRESYWRMKLKWWWGRGGVADSLLMIDGWRLMMVWWLKIDELTTIDSWILMDGLGRKRMGVDSSILSISYYKANTSPLSRLSSLIGRFYHSLSLSPLLRGIDIHLSDQRPFFNFSFLSVVDLFWYSVDAWFLRMSLDTPTNNEFFFPLRAPLLVVTFLR